MGLAHAEHLDDTLIGSVDTILRTTVALGYPHTLVLLHDGVADILREMERTAIEVLDAATRTLYLEHLVALADVDDQLTRHEVGTKGDLRRIKVLRQEIILQQAGIEHDVTMIADIEVVLVATQPFDARTSELSDTLFDHPLVDAEHRLRLELMRILITSYPATHLFDGLGRIDIRR